MGIIMGRLRPQVGGQTGAAVQNSRPLPVWRRRMPWHHGVALRSPATMRSCGMVEANFAISMNCFCQMAAVWLLIGGGGCVAMTVRGLLSCSSCMMRLG